MKRKITILPNNCDSMGFIAFDMRNSYHILDHNLNDIYAVTQTRITNQDYCGFGVKFITEHTHHCNIRVALYYFDGSAQSMIISVFGQRDIIEAYNNRADYLIFQAGNYVIKQPIDDARTYAMLQRPHKIALYLILQFDLIVDIKRYISSIILRLLREDTSWYQEKQ